MKSRKKKLFFLLILISVIVILYFSGLRNYFSFENFKLHRDELLQRVNKHYFTSALYYILIYIILVISTLPLNAFLTIISGFLFDLLPAVIFSVIAAVIGCTISFLIFRYFLKKFVQSKHSKKLDRFNRNIEKYGAIYLLSIQFATIFPFFIINALAAMTKIRLKTFMWTTAVGIIPGTFLYAFAGKQLATINSFNEIFSPQIVTAFSLLALFAVASLFIKKFKH